MASQNIGFTLADLHETALKKIKEEFAEQLSEDEYKVLLDTKAPSEVFENLHSDEFEAGKGRRVLEKSLANLERFESALDALTGSMPEFVGLNLVGLIWGGMKFVIVVAKDVVETSNIILDIIASVSNALPTHEIYQKLFATSDIQLLRVPITEMYGLLLEFAIMAIEWGTKGALKKIGSATIRPMQERFRDLQGRIEGVSRQIEKMTMVEFMNKTSNQFENQDAKLDSIKREIQLFSARTVALSKSDNDDKAKRVNGTPIQLLSRSFCGRDEELKKLNSIFYEKGEGEDADDGETGDITAAVIIGMHGLGKSQVAIKYADTAFRTKKVDCVFWIQASSEQKLKHDYAAILDLMEHKERFNPDEDKKLIAARRLLEDYEPVEGTERGWLLVFDNVVADAVEALRDLLPRQQERNCGRILITTRSSSIAEEFETPDMDGEHIIELQTMSIDDSVNILLRKKKGKGAQALNRSEAEEIVKRVGLLPVAVDQAAAFMAKGKKTTGEMLEIYEEGNKFEILSWENSLTKYEEKSVVATFRSTFEDLVKSDPMAANILRALVFLDSDGLALSTLKDGASAWKEGAVEWEKWDWWSWREFKGWTIPEVEEYMKLDSEKAEGSAGTERKSVPPEKKKSRFRRMFGLSKKHEEPLINFEKASSKSVTKEKSATAVSAQGMSAEDKAKLKALYLDGPLEDDKAQSLLATLTSSIKLQDALLTLEDYSLIKISDSTIILQDLVCFIIRSLMDPSERKHWVHFGVSLLRGTFSKLPSAKDKNIWPKYDLTLPHVKKILSLATNEEVTGRQLWFIVQRTWKYLDKRMRSAQEIAFLEPLLKDLAEVLGSDHPAALDIRQVLSEAYDDVERYPEALEGFQKCYSAYKTLYGPENMTTLAVLSRIACIYGDQGNISKAIHTCLQAHSGLSKNYGETHHATLAALQKLARLHQKEHDYGKATELLKKVVDGQRRVFGPDHLQTIYAGVDLGEVYIETTDYAKAEEVLKDARRRIDDTLGKEHPIYIEATCHLARTFFQEGEFDDALELYEEAISASEKENGTDHLTTLDMMHNLASVYEAQEEYEEALELYERALAGYRKLKGKNDPFTLDTLLSLSSLYEEMEDYDKSLALASQAYEGYKSAHGAQSASSLRALTTKAFILSKTGDLDGALELNAQALEGFYEVYGGESTHLDVRKATDNQADYYAAKEEWEGAVEWAEKAAKLYERAYGAEHEYAKSARDDVNEYMKKWVETH